jgi:uncharacterized protein YdeI (YjbR/CyaY-like superfamily)
VATNHRDKRIDAYIAKSADFAQPILRALREIVHEGCPEVVEGIKWGNPAFDYKGMLCGMAAFKQHCAFGFWKGSLILDDKDKSLDAMGQFGRITCMKDLPPKSHLLRYIKKAMELNDAGVTVARKTASPAEKKALKVPSYFLAALKKNKKALATYTAFPYSKKKDYVDWVTEAKTEETRDRRMQTAVEWIAEGKGRNWKYEKC